MKPDAAPPTVHPRSQEVIAMTTIAPLHDKLHWSREAPRAWGPVPNTGQDGATVAIADIRGEHAEALSSKLNADGLRTVALPMDVTDADAAQSAVRRFHEQYGKLDILINNAAIDKTVSVEELTVPEWDRILATNLRGPFVMSKSALQIMIKRRAGHIINIVSTAAKRAWANASAYHASKWGLLPQPCASCRGALS